MDYETETLPAETRNLQNSPRDHVGAVVDTQPTARRDGRADANSNDHQPETLEQVLASPQVVGQDDRKTKSAPDAINVASQPGRDVGTSHLTSPPPAPQPRASLQLFPAAAQAHKLRASEEFDRRFDGPFGRPSLAMMRRRSSQVPIPEASEPMDVVPGPVAAVPATAQVFQAEPPPLNYTLHTRKLSILFFWTIIVFDSVAMPIALYFGLWYGVGPGKPEDTRLSANTVFSIVTAAIGGASIVEYFLRFWRLWRKGSTCRVIGAHRWYLDWFHWMFSLAWIIIMVELIVGSVQDDPFIRLLSMPLTTMLFVFGTLLLVIDGMRWFQVPAPVRISSIPKGAQLRPGIYSVIEDICSTDGSGGTAFRIALDARYASSHIFRAMLRRLGIFWAVGAEACAVLCTILVFGLYSVDAAYAIGWSLPFVWAGFWTAATFWYVKRELRKEKELWVAEASKYRA